MSLGVAGGCQDLVRIAVHRRERFDAGPVRDTRSLRFWGPRQLETDPTVTRPRVTEEEELVMNHHRHLGLAAGPCIVVIACVLLVAGCQDGSGPGLVTSPEGKPAYDGAKPPPPPPADPAIAFYVRPAHPPYYLKVMDADGSNVATIYTSTSLMLGWPSWSPDGHSIAFMDGSPSPDLWRIDVSVVNGAPVGSNATRLLDRTTSIWHPAWSPLGDQIAFVDLQQRTIEVIPAAGGVPSVLYTSPVAFGLGLAWSPDASKIAFVESPSASEISLHVLDINDRTVTTVLGSEWGQQLGGGGPTVPDWARTQDMLAFQGPQGMIYTMQLPSGTPTLVAEGNWPTWSPDDREILFTSPRGSFTKVNLATGLITRLGSGMWPDWRRF